MKSTGLSQESMWHLEAADGFMDLQMLEKAAQKLNQIPAGEHEHAVFKTAQARLMILQKCWPEAIRLCRELRELADQPGIWVQLAYATRRSASLEEAREVLLKAVERYPNEAVIVFNLACYECQLQHRDMALAYLAQAVKLEPAFKDIALEDTDLEPIWSDII